LEWVIPENIHTSPTEEIGSYPTPFGLATHQGECLVAQWVNFVTQLFFSGVIPHIHKSLIGKKGTAKPQ
jgi:hypothetical protein